MRPTEQMDHEWSLEVEIVPPLQTSGHKGIFIPCLLLLILVQSQPTISFGTNGSSHGTIYSKFSRHMTIYCPETQASR